MTGDDVSREMSHEALKETYLLCLAGMENPPSPEEFLKKMTEMGYLTPPSEGGTIRQKD